MRAFAIRASIAEVAKADVQVGLAHPFLGSTRQVHPPDHREIPDKSPLAEQVAGEDPARAGAASIRSLRALISRVVTAATTSSSTIST